MMATDMATGRSWEGGTGGGGSGLLPGIEKIYNDSNMNVRKISTNRVNTAANSKTKTSIEVKGGGLDSDLGWATNFMAVGRFGRCSVFAAVFLL